MSMSDEIDPRTWFWRAVGAVGILVLLWFGVVRPYNNYVSAKAVAAALKDERAKTEPVFNELTTNFKALEATFRQITDASTAERNKRTAELDRKTKELTNALNREKELNKNLDALRSSDAAFQRLLDNATAADNSAINSSNSARLQRLSDVHRQCQRALREANDDAANALRLLGEALASINALKN